jgi:hypothetical protein
MLLFDGEKRINLLFHRLHRNAACCGEKRDEIGSRLDYFLIRFLKDFTSP